MTTYTLAEAKANFSKVVDEAMTGQPVLVTKYGHPAALITLPEPRQAPTKRQLHGCLKEQFVGWQLPDDFDHMAEDEIISMFAGFESIENAEAAGGKRDKESRGGASK